MTGCAKQDAGQRPVLVAVKRVFRPEGSEDGGIDLFVGQSEGEDVVGGEYARLVHNVLSEFDGE